MSSSGPDELGDDVDGRPSDDGAPPPAPGRRRVSPLTVVGIVLLVAGLTCLGYVGFQYVGTNVISEKAFQTERDQLRARWTQEQVTDPKNRAAEQDPIPGEAIGLLRVPAFGAAYEIPVIDGTGLDVLAKGVGHYTSTAQPGQVGNFAIAGHRVTHGQPFSRLLELKAGDQVVVETRQAVYTYVLDEAPEQLTVRDSDTWVIDPVPGKPAAEPAQALITLTTCQDLFHSPDRSVGFGHLMSTQNK